MHDRMRIWIAACFYYSGLVPLIRWWTRHVSPGLIILNYHRAADGDLRSHLLYLRRHYRILHLDTALSELYHSCEDKAVDLKKPIDRRTRVALTFDDGYYDNYTHAFSLACELEIPLTLFLVPGYIENGHPFWWLEGKRLVTHAQERLVTLEGTTYHLVQSSERNALISVIEMRVRCAAAVAEREEFLHSLRMLLNASAREDKEELLTRPLTWAEVQEMASSAWISFGAHTMHHPVLAYLNSPAELRYEIEQSRIILEQRLGVPIRSFAYPLGKPEHIGKMAPVAVHEAGYQWAVTSIPGHNMQSRDPYLLLRKNAGANQHWLVMAADTAGVWLFFSRLYNSIKYSVQRTVPLFNRVPFRRKGCT